MKKWKRITALGLSAMMIASLTACGGSGDKKESKKSGDSKGTTITFWNSFTGADGDMLVKMVDKYNKENKDGITVKMDISSDLDSQLSTAFAANEGPTMILSSSAYRFTYGDYLQDVSDVFDKTNLDKDDFIQSYLDYCSDDESMYFVPFQVVGYYMYWNKDLFKDAGLDPDTPPATWMNGRKMQLRLLMQTRMFTVREFLMIMLIRLHISCSDLEDLRLQMTTETGKLILKAMQDMKNS